MFAFTFALAFAFAFMFAFARLPRLRAGGAPVRSPVGEASVALVVPVSVVAGCLPFRRAVARAGVNMHFVPPGTDVRVNRSPLLRALSETIFAGDPGLASPT